MKIYDNSNSYKKAIRNRIQWESQWKNMVDINSILPIIFFVIIYLNRKIFEFVIVWNLFTKLVEYDINFDKKVLLRK
jgi:hypothetical protein